MKPRHDLGEFGFLENRIELAAYTFTAYTIQQRNRLIQQLQCPIFNLKIEPLLQSDRPQYSCWVIHEAQGMQDADLLIPQIPAATPMVEQLTVITTIQSQREGVNRKITAMQVELDTPTLDRRQRGRVSVELRTGADEVQIFRKRIGLKRFAFQRRAKLPVPKIKLPFRRSKTLMAALATTIGCSQAPRQTYRIPLHDDVIIRARCIEDQIADETAYDVESIAALFRLTCDET